MRIMLPPGGESKHGTTVIGVSRFYRIPVLYCAYNATAPQHEHAAIIRISRRQRVPRSR